MYLATYQHHPAVLRISRRGSQKPASTEPPFVRKMVHMDGTSDVTRLVRAGLEGDPGAWKELVHRYAPLVIAVTRNYGLGAMDGQDVSQTVWLRLVEHLGNLRTPEALPGWIVRTTERECRRYVRRARRIVPVDPHADAATERQATPDLDAGLLRAELRQALRDGIAELPTRDQWLLRLRAADPPKSYQEISKLTGMPIGSIGPTFQRCMNRLRQSSAMRAYLADSSGQQGPQRRWSA
jgi:RNA polymerase sigma factor (sigma-70 family)